MKAIYIIITVLFLTVSCNSSKKNNPQEETGKPASLSSVLSENEDSTETKTDALSSATSFINDASFNGIFVLSPQRHASVTLSINGIVKTTTLLPGKHVQKGELIATLENPEFINLQQNYLDACAQCEYFEEEYKRQEILAREDVASQKRFQQSKAEYLSMKSRRDADAAQLSLLGLSPESIATKGMTPLLEVLAPISGYVSNLQMNTGKYIAAGEPLCEIIDKSDILIRLTAYEKDLIRIKTGDKIRFSVNGIENERFMGKVISVGQRVDNVNRSLEVYAKVLEDHPLFRPGMYVNAQVVGK